MSAAPVTEAVAGLDPVVVFWLMLIASIVAMVTTRLRVPYAIGLVLVGLGLGVPHLLPQAHLDPHVLFTIFLPPLLFEAAINLRTDALQRAWRPIAALALVGTLLATIVSGGLAHLVLGLPLATALVFAALMAPTDPISVMAILKRLGVEHDLAMIVEAESLFNDGVAVVLFAVLLGAAMGGSLGLFEGVSRFCIVVIGGAGIGLLVGGAASWVTRAFNDHLLEITLTTIVAFGAYLCAESVHVSGVVAVVIAGLVVGNWGMRTGMSPTTRLAVHAFWEYAAFAGNSLVFLLVGIEAANVRWWTHLPTVAVAFLVVLAGRAVAVYAVTPWFDRPAGELPWRWRHLLVWGGLRGALSMALALGLPAGMPHRDLLVAMTFGVVLASLLLQGLSVGSLVSWLKLSVGHGLDDRWNQLSAERLAWSAAADEIDRAVKKGTIPPGAAAAVGGEFRERLKQTDAAIAELHLSDDSLQAAQEATAYGLAYRAARQAVREASLAGIVSGGAEDALARRIDDALARHEAIEDEALAEPTGPQLTDDAPGGA